MDRHTAPSNDPLYGMPRAMRLLRCSHPTVVKWAREGRFPIELIDGRMYVRRSALLAFKRQASAPREPMQMEEAQTA